MRIRWHDFSKGLWLIGGSEHTVPGFLRRARGMNAIRTPSLRSRLGSTRLYQISSNSLVRYNDVRFNAGGGSFYRDGVSILSGLDGNRLAFARMPPQVALFDYLFLTGGGLIRKVDSAGAVTTWGIAAPTTNPTVAVGAAGALNATYTYWVTFRNSVTGSRSNANPVAQAITPASQQVNLTAIPTSSDAQVDSREIYRSVAGGAVGFLLTTIANNTATTYTDNAADSTLGTQQLQFDNDPPASTYRDAWGPFAGSLWWTRDSVSGAQGRVYYSPRSRPESVDSFLEVTNPDDPLQKGLLWNRQNWVISERGLFELYGDNPFYFREVTGVPGTTRPFTLSGSPYGILYQAQDGPRLFDGLRSQLLDFERIGPIFRGEAVENLTSFTGVVGAYARDEYWLSDGTQTIVFNLKHGTWRDLGLGCTAFFQEPDTSVFLAAFNSEVYALEDFSVATLPRADGPTAIPLAWELGGVLSDISVDALLQRLYLDINTNGSTITVTLIRDGVEQTITNLNTTSRQLVEYSINETARVFSIRLTGNVTTLVELFGVELDVYIPSVALAP